MVKASSETVDIVCSSCRTRHSSLGSDTPCCPARAGWLIRALRVDCRRCQAKAGERCFAALYEGRRTTPHDERRADAPGKAALVALPIDSALIEAARAAINRGEVPGDAARLAGLTPRIVCEAIFGGDWGAYKRACARQSSKQRYPSILKRADVLQRYGGRCVVTGHTHDLEVHHLDGNRRNAGDTNLVPLHKSVHKLLTHGVSTEYDHELLGKFGVWAVSAGWAVRAPYCGTCRRHHVEVKPLTAPSGGGNGDCTLGPSTDRR